jgi:hypothetical protein
MQRLSKSSGSSPLKKFAGDAQAIGTAKQNESLISSIVAAIKDKKAEE